MIVLGSCRYDPEAGHLVDAGGVPILLRKKSAETLAVLAETPGRLVSKDRIAERVWGEVFASDESLAQCIRDIRKALGDHARQIVQTIPGRGFLLVGTASKPERPAGMPVIQVGEIAVRAEGDEAPALALRLRQDILAAISRRSGIRVAAGVEPAETVDYDIRGTVTRAGNALTVYMEIEERGGRGVFFAEAFEMGDEAVEAMADRVARKVTNVQRVSAIQHFGKRLLQVPEAEMDLQQLLQKAAYHYSRITEEDTDAARQVLAAATARFPESPMALAMQAATYVHMYPLVAVDRSEARVAEALALAERAVFAGPEVDFAIRTRGNLKFWLKGDVDGAVADCARALAITPNYQLAHLTLVQCDLFSGAVDAARARFLRQIEVDIALPQYHYFQTLLALFALGEGASEAALYHAREAVDVAPWSDWGVLVLAVAGGAADGALAARIGRMAIGADHFLSLPSRDAAYLGELAARARAAGVPGAPGAPGSPG